MKLFVVGQDWPLYLFSTIIHYWLVIDLMQLLTTECGHDLPPFFSCFANQIGSVSVDEVWFLPPVFPIIAF